MNPAAMLRRLRHRRLLRQLEHAGRGVTLGPCVEILQPQRVRLDNDVTLRTCVILQPGRHQIAIGRGSGINPYVCIYGQVEIGAYAMIAPHVVLAGGNHAIDDTDTPMILQGRGTSHGIVVEDDVWLAAHAVVTDGVRIGRGAVVAAGAVVTRDVSPYDIVAGVPATRIGSRHDHRRSAGSGDDPALSSA